MARVFSGIQPTGDLHLGNLLGAVTNWVADLDDDDAIFCIVDLHALTDPQGSGRALGPRPSSWPSCSSPPGLDPERCTLFVQSHVPAHAELAWLMECTASYGELSAA